MNEAIENIQTEGVMGIIARAASDPQVDPAKMQALLNVKQSWEADEARKAFARDMAEFQSRCPIIAKGDEAYGKRYARIDRIHRETRELRKQCGFWFAWKKCEVRDGLVFMEGLLGHRSGHTEDIKQTIPLPDELKGQNETQRAGSAMTYAKRYGECLALDIVTGEDDDGNRGKQETPKGPARATDKHRARMVVNLTGLIDRAVDYGVCQGYLQPGQGLDQWPLDHVPMTAEQMAELKRKVEAHV